jgi:hypothetical protein
MNVAWLPLNTKPILKPNPAVTIVRCVTDLLRFMITSKPEMQNNLDKVQAHHKAISNEMSEAESFFAS